MVFSEVRSSGLEMLPNEGIVFSDILIILTLQNKKLHLRIRYADQIVPEQG